MGLPRVVALQNTHTSPTRSPYLANNVDSNSPLTFSGETVFSPFARFIVEPAQDGLVQLRSCYHNRLWARKSDHENTIVTSSDSVKDKSSWQCTLFKPTIVESTITFLHVQLGKNLIITKDKTEKVAVDDGSSGNEILTAMIINLETLVKLPKYVQFRSENGKLLRAAEFTYYLPAPVSWKPTEEFAEGDRYEFVKASETSSTSVASMFEVIDNLGDSTNCFKYAKNGKIWGAGNILQKWVFITYGTVSVSNPRCQFEPVKTEENDVIALKNYFHQAYIKRFTTFDYTDCFSAMGGSIDDTSRLKVEEPIKQRIVQVKKIRYEAFRIISDEKEVVIDSQEVINREDSELNKTVKFTRYDEYETRKWTKTVSIQTQTEFFFKSPFPVYKDGKFSDGSGEADEKNYQWGKILERKKNMVQENYSVKVPPRSIRTAKLVARKIVFEIPFNFDQNDVNSINGESILLDDQCEGLYLGVLQFDYKIMTF